MKYAKKSEAGALLIEALVALVVVGIGTFGVMKLSSAILAATGESKTRAEALQLAQKRIEDVRNYSVQVGCPAAAVTTESTATTGINATYAVGRTISNVVSERVDISVFVGWDGASDPRNSAVDKRMELKTVVSCVGSGTSAMVGGNASSQNGGTVKTPTGSARVGGRTGININGSDCGTGCSVIRTNSDGTKVIQTGNKVELVNSSGDALLTIEDGSDFSSISGRVYIEANSSGNPIVAPAGTTYSSESDDNVFVLSSDASYCARIFPSNLDLSKAPANTSGNATKYRYFEYNCYVSKSWWGNIGIIRLDNPNANNRVCLGDVNVSSSETSIWSRKSALAISRGYRGFRKINANGSDSDAANFETVGIGYSLVNGVVSSTYSPFTIGKDSNGNRTSEHHDFLITVINGQATCQSSGQMVLTGTTTSNEFTGNVGAYYCMSGQCPQLTSGATQQTTVVRGTITAENSNAIITDIDPADCQTTPTLTYNSSNNTYSYSCTKVWTGFAGSSWAGGVTFRPPASGTGSTTTICANSSGSVATVTPSGATVASTVNDKNATTNPNSLSFTDVALSVTDIVINFDAKATSCNKLGQPALSWGNGSNPKTLSWTAITATGASVSYNVASCTATGTSCTPSTIASQTTTSVVPPNLSNGQAYCVTVTATDLLNVWATGTPSSPKCVYRTTANGNNWVYP